MQQEKNVPFSSYPFPFIQTKEDMNGVDRLDDVFLRLEAIQKNITYEKIAQCETALEQLEGELTAFINGDRSLTVEEYKHE